MRKAVLALQIAGVAGSDHARAALLHLAKLTSRITSLALLLPNLSTTCHHLVTAGSLNMSRGTTHVPPLAHHLPVNASGEANLAEWLLLHLGGGPPSKGNEGLWLDILAIRWLHSAAVRCFGDQIPYYRLSLASPSDDYKEITSNKTKRNALSGGASEAGYQYWLDQIAKHAPNCGLLRAVYDLKDVVERDFSFVHHYHPRPPPRLNERHLLANHWHFPRPHEREQLTKLLERELSDGLPDYCTVGFEVATEIPDGPIDEVIRRRLQTWHRFEAALIALSVQSCRPIRSILRWRVYVDPAPPSANEKVQLVQHGKLYLKFVWIKGTRSGLAEVDLHHGVEQWLKAIHPGLGAPTIGELLPYSKRPWDVRAYEHLAKLLGCTPQRAELICRDFVPRLLYEATANTALVNFWRSDSNSPVSRPDRLALPHYLQPNGNRTCATFAEACSQALGPGTFPFRSKHREPVKVTGENYALPSAQLVQIREALQLRYDSSTDAIDKHNSLTYLTLFICVLATGHRRSETPFPFPWDFFPSEGLVFICDKLITGSEARFVPLVGAPLAQLHVYARHLERLRNTRGVSSATQWYADATCKLLSFVAVPPKESRRKDFSPWAGVFFLLDSDGNISKRRLSTRALDAHVESLTGVPRLTRRLRATLASHLWESGCSGRLVQAFLGHQPELHVHGPASTWSVHDVAKQLNPHLETFFTKELGLVSPPQLVCFSSPYFPPINICDQGTKGSSSVAALGYEARAREKKWAQYRVASLIRQELAADLMDARTEDAPLRFNNLEDKARIEQRIREELWNDPRALKLVSSALDEQLAKFGKTRGAFPNGPLTDTPGPIEIGFARLLRCAQVLRSVWEHSVGTPIGTKEFDALEALAHLTISLVCFDGVVSKQNLQSVVEAAMDCDLEVHFGKVILRGRALTATHDYEYGVAVGPISTALLAGVRRRVEQIEREKGDAISWPSIEQRVIYILRKLVNLGEQDRWTVARLLLVFRPYWLLRLPGAMYSVAIGENKGPAADQQSEALLQGKPPKKIPPRVAASSTCSRTNEDNRRTALRDLKRLFSYARGQREAGEHRKKIQRAKLRSAVREMSGQLDNGSAAPQIVDLLVSFIDRLLERGGPRTAHLAFSTMEKYFGSIAEQLVIHAWDFDFESSDTQSLAELLDQLSKKVDPPHGPMILNEFAAHVRDTFSVPYFPRWADRRQRIRVRSSLLTPRQVSRALSFLLEKEDIYSRHAAILIALCAGYGLRRSEAFGLARDRFDQSDKLHLSVTRSRISDLKTRCSRRVIPSLLLGEQLKEIIENAREIAITSPHLPGYLFEYTTRDLHISQTASVASVAIGALRQHSGLPTAVLHHLRHSYGTWLGLAVLAMPDQQHGLSKMAKRFLGEKWDKVIKEILPVPTGWPFAIDAIASTLGHASVNTFLDTYFHASHLVISERCHRWQPESLTQERLARLLFVERTKVTKLKRKLEAVPNSHSVTLWDLVEKFTSPFEEDSSPGEADNAKAPSTPHVEHWALVFRALEYRLANDLSLNEMWQYATKHLGYSPGRIQFYASRYEHLVHETGLDDFEPASSELVNPVVSHSRGISRGRFEREAFVNRVQQWVESKPERRSALNGFMDIWFRHVSPVRPRIVCKSFDELRLVVSFLEQLGVSRRQLSIELHGDPNAPLLCDAITVHPQAVRSSGRSSRGSRRVKTVEISVGVDQADGSLVPDGRDLHRALVGLYLFQDLNLTSCS